MAGKKKQDKDSWVADIESYSRQIWLAGLGAYAKVGKEGVKLFESLIKDGEAAEKTAREEIDKQVESLKTKASKASKGGKDTLGAAQSKVEKSKDKIAGRWNGLEEAFEKRLNSAVSRLGVPSRDEVKELDAKVDELTRLVEQMVSGNAPPAKVAPKAVPKATAKPAAKPAAAKAKAPAKPKPAAKSKPAAKADEAASTKAAPKAEPKATAKPASPKPKAAPKPRAPRKPKADVKPKADAAPKADSAADDKSPAAGSSSAS
jgi:poly(hydroxyalkanoate) granule-associated protein